jgi:SET domain-containing protein
LLAIEQDEKALSKLLQRVYLPALFSAPTSDKNLQPLHNAFNGMHLNGKTKLAQSVQKVWILSISSTISSWNAELQDRSKLMEQLREYLDSLKDTSISLEKLMALKLLINDTNSCPQFSSKIELLIENFLFKNLEKVFEKTSELEVFTICDIVITAANCQQSDSAVDLCKLLTSTDTYLT